MKSTGGWVATGVVAVLLEPTVTLLARLDKAVAAHRTLKQGPGLVPQAVVHAVFKGKSKILQAA